MTTSGVSLPRLLAGVVVTACGLAHFAWPVKFEPINRQLGFTRNTRTHVYVNGGVETALGLTLMSGRARTINFALSVTYPIYLMLNALRARR
ncbi:hypothetical protein BST36_24295 [Mycolicibacterium moriokaense]|uniref:hypothetical protein n=1 Tax=Mycolicibacterium moriokaense TaxID=39691 RepID=UPI000A09A7F9|nr:hypothetical protein [Mycolicibacterium moriokaense]MCV7043008.1 hypothetical protein [Mycolicibacterium moriokaense]ORB17980.1 hypothetical protein BST36_24295 [Mycolicibacterium moriokaense]